MPCCWQQHPILLCTYLMSKLLTLNEHAEAPNVKQTRTKQGQLGSGSSKDVEQSPGLLQQAAQDIGAWLGGEGGGGYTRGGENGLRPVATCCSGDIHPGLATDAQDDQADMNPHMNIAQPPHRLLKTL